MFGPHDGLIPLVGFSMNCPSPQMVFLCFVCLREGLFHSKVLFNVSCVLIKDRTPISCLGS